VQQYASEMATIVSVRCYCIPSYKHVYILIFIFLVPKM
jgi:hypothetical protein